MTSLFETIGVDYQQWKAVSGTLLKTDFRLPLSGTSSSRSTLFTLFTLVVTMGLFGLAAAIVVLITRDVLLSGTIVLSYLSIMLTTALLTQHGASMLSAADHVILGSRPVTSRTVLAIRVTNVLFHTLLMTTLMAYPVILAYVFAHGISVARGGAAFAAVYAWSITVTLTLVATYGMLLRIVGAARFHRAIGYLQLIGGFLAYGGLLLASRRLTDSLISNVAVPDAPWLLLVPPAWFASYLELSTGTGNSTTLLRGVLSAAALIGLVAAIRGKMGLDYAQQLAEITTASTASTTPATRTPFFSTGEARAVAILVVAHFRHDVRVRMGVLGIVPLVLLYLLLGTREASVDLVAVAVLLFPALLSQHFASTDAYQAAWLYRSTPSDLSAIVVALKNVAVVYFLLPFLVFVAAIFTWRMGDVARAVVHTTMLGLLSHIALQGSLIISPRLPFALPPNKMRGSGFLMGWLLFVILGGNVVLVALDRWVYLSSAATAAVLAVLVALTWILNRIIRMRARHV